jgi:hypothetical protein
MSDELQVTLTVEICFKVSRGAAENKTPFEVAAMLQSRLNPTDCFVFNAKIEVETEDGTELREAIFGVHEGDYLTGIFSGDKRLAEDYLGSVPPGERAAWVVPDKQ